VVDAGLPVGSVRLSFIDRLILALLVAPLKADFSVTDVQLGLLFGPAFGLFYCLVGLPHGAHRGITRHGGVAALQPLSQGRRL
jgi:hypothetical protein